MAESKPRCQLDRLPKSITETGDDGYVWEPWIPDACRRCLLRALRDDAVPKEVADTSEEVEAELVKMDIDPEVVDREHHFWIKVTNGSKRSAIEEAGIDLGGAKRDWPTLKTKVNFDCYVEGYKLSQREGEFLYSILVPDPAYIADGRGDGLTSYFYKKALEGQPEVLLTAVYEAESLLEKDNDGNPLYTELNELKIDRLLAMVADLPLEMELFVKTDVWEIIVEAEWLHWAESTFALERTVSRLGEQDPGFLPQLVHLIEGTISTKTSALREKTGFDKNLVLPSEPGEVDTLTYIMDHHPGALVQYKSLDVLYGALQQANRSLAQARQG